MSSFLWVLERKKPFKGSLSGEFREDPKFEMELMPVKVQSENAVIITENESGKFTVEPPPLYTYKGKVEGIKNSRVTFTVSSDVVIGVIELGETRQTRSTVGGWFTLSIAQKCSETSQTPLPSRWMVMR